MSHLTLTPSTLPDLSVSQLAALSQQELQEFDISLAMLATWVKLSRDRLNTALEQRYGEQARTALLESGRDFGVTHLSDGQLRVTYELPKRVSWDQAQLSKIAERIVAAGDRIQDYMDVDLSVSESRFNNWPPALKEQFSAARTVKPGKPTFRLARVEGESA
ncbi:hypothetical protein OYT1_ch1243 [Ferriphaselus amnicola]|uniref:Uncharacterized protein n=1 Tax=Ferriphaselus amnicola TaxID=1188319 RepID=A0A2Z6GBN6_9PROT|nr:hypothetical protein [Ferriphaselus amnicola]BBE50800.1 hypothetical protein OYT1_ch1243 [Ferriphaselus amnicola]